MAKTKADGYYIEVKNKTGYPSNYISLKVTNNNTSRFWFGGGNITRTAIFKTYKFARNIAIKQIKIFNRKHNGDFIFYIQSIKILGDFKKTN